MTKTGWQWRLKISNSGTTQQFTDMNLTSFPDFTLIEECVLFVNLGLPIFSTYQYRVKTTYITTFFFFLLLCFPEHCFCCLCLLFYPILYSFLFYSLLACVVILSHCVSIFLLFSVISV